MSLSRMLNTKLNLTVGLMIIGSVITTAAILGAFYLGYAWVDNGRMAIHPPPENNNSFNPPDDGSDFLTSTAIGVNPSDTPTATSTPVTIPSETPTPLPSETSDLSATLTSTATPTPTQAPDDWAALISFSPIQGSYFKPLATYTRVWTIKNIGSTTWTKDYDLVFISGTKMTNYSVIPLPSSVSPGKTIEITLKQNAPKDPGTYQGTWMLRNKAGQRFGIGDNAEDPLISKITVLKVSPSNKYDFLLNYCQASWLTNRGTSIKCPSAPQTTSGFVNLSTMPYLEKGRSDNPVIWVHPNNVLEGHITGTYPAYGVKPGDHFMAKVGCMGGYPRCNVTFKLLYKIGSGSYKTLGAWHEDYNGKITTIDVDLTPLAGQKVQFMLGMYLSNKYPDQAQGFWMLPRIEYVQPSPTRTPTATPTFTPEPPTDTPTPEPPVYTPEPSPEPPVDTPEPTPGNTGG